jgi:peptide chain release factor 3
MNNFGVKLMLDGFSNICLRPARLMAGNYIAPEQPIFGIHFQIQANMIPASRRIAFLRICSGKFERDMTVTHCAREKVRLQFHKLFANERETVNEAFPGDIIGLVGYSDLASVTR